jgi:hypothetical protein
MWHFTKILFAIVCLLSIAKQTLADTDLKDLIKITLPSVALIEKFDSNGKRLGFGTGFFINNQGCIVSNYHVLEGASKAKITTSKGLEFPVTHIVDQDKSNDLILLITGGESPFFLDVSKELPQIGEKIYVIGHPLGLQHTIGDGIISSIRTLPNFNCKMLQITAPTSPGSSGGPVLNMRGQVIGVVTAKCKEGENLNFAVNSTAILSLSINNLAKKTFQEWAFSENKSLNSIPNKIEKRTDQKSKELQEAKARADHMRQQFEQRVSAERKRLDIRSAELSLEYNAILNEKRELDYSRNFIYPSQYNHFLYELNVRSRNFEFKRRQLDNDIDSFNRWIEDLSKQLDAEFESVNSKSYSVDMEKQIVEAEIARQKNEEDVVKWSMEESIRIILKDGSVIKTSAVWEENKYIAYKKYGGTIKIEKAKVKEIIN